MITDVLVMGARQEHIDKINAWLDDNDGRKQHLLPISTEAAGGAKVFTSDLWAAAFNYMPLDLLDILRNPKTWQPGLLSVIVAIDGEDDQQVMLFGSRGDWKREDVFAKALERFDYDVIEVRDYAAPDAEILKG